MISTMKYNKLWAELAECRKEYSVIVSDLMEAAEKAGRMERQRDGLAEILIANCEYHHLPLINGWCHQLELDSKTIRCRLSEEARFAIQKMRGLDNVVLHCQEKAALASVQDE